VTQHGQIIDAADINQTSSNTMSQVIKTGVSYTITKVNNNLSHGSHYYHKILAGMHKREFFLNWQNIVHKFIPEGDRLTRRGTKRCSSI
jgi:hypothetical protein